MLTRLDRHLRHSNRARLPWCEFCTSAGPLPLPHCSGTLLLDRPGRFHGRNVYFVMPDNTVRVYVDDSRYFLIDRTFVDTAANYLWRTSLVGPKGHKKLYVVSTSTSLHRLVLRAADGQYVDHKNGDTLDNRKKNLRIATQSQNIANAGVRPKPTFSEIQYKGVTYQARRTKPYLAQITHQYKNYYLGHYRTQEEAAEAYNNAALRFFGPFALLNDVTSEDRRAA